MHIFSTRGTSHSEGCILLGNFIFNYQLPKMIVFQSYKLNSVYKANLHLDALPLKDQELAGVLRYIPREVVVTDTLMWIECFIILAFMLGSNNTDKIAPPLCTSQNGDAHFQKVSSLIVAALLLLWQL